jgi:hypothetical protein
VRVLGSDPVTVMDGGALAGACGWAASAAHAGTVSTAAIDRLEITFITCSSRVGRNSWWRAHERFRGRR